MEARCVDWFIKGEVLCRPKINYLQLSTGLPDVHCTVTVRPLYSQHYDGKKSRTYKNDEVRPKCDLGCLWRCVYSPNCAWYKWKIYYYSLKDQPNNRTITLRNIIFSKLYELLPLISTCEPQKCKRIVWWSILAWT